MTTDNEVLAAVRTSVNNVARELESDGNLKVVVESDENGTTISLNDGDELDECFVTLSKSMKQEAVAENFEWAFCDSSSGDWWDSKLDVSSSVEDVVSFVNECIAEIEDM